MSLNQTHRNCSAIGSKLTFSLQKIGLKIKLEE